MKLLLFISSLLLTTIIKAQTGVFIDDRDQQVYKTIVIEGKTWFRENLRFQTTKSFCPNFNKDSADCRAGNFYSNSELNTICPRGWHVATIAEWDSFLKILFRDNNINGGVLKYDTARMKDNFGITLPKSVLFSDTLLNLVPTGWVEGAFLKKNDALSVWAIDTETRDDKYHFHFGNNGLTKHSHEHNILDKPKKVRKFAVRCVCEGAQ
jgi:uncharacterized protein (TIGR02145 family)